MDEGQLNRRNTYDDEVRLRRTAEALNNAICTYERIINNQIPSSAQLKKTVQDSIKELCTVILDIVG